MFNQVTRKEFLKIGGISSISFLMGCHLDKQEAEAAPNPVANPNHPNVAIIQRYYDAYGKGDLNTVRQIFAPDIRWRIPGHHSLAGVHKGPDQVFAFFQQLAKAKFKADVLFLGGNDSYVVDVHRGYSNMERDNIDILWAFLFQIKNGRIVEATNFPGDQHAADAFYSRVYPLKPLPDRLA